MREKTHFMLTRMWSSIVAVIALCTMDFNIAGVWDVAWQVLYSNE
jgi:hypothetical protein